VGLLLEGARGCPLRERNGGKDGCRNEHDRTAGRDVERARERQTDERRDGAYRDGEP
jgi:hypothetical protein